MKTLKTFFVLLAVIVASSSYGQTKEETMEWLNTNGRDFLEMSYKNSADFKMSGELQKIKSDTLIFYQNFYRRCSTCDNIYETIKVPFNYIKYQEINSIPIKIADSSTRKFPDGTPYFIVKVNSKFSRVEVGNETNQKWSTYGEGTLEIPFDKANEENAKRALKAIMHLAKLSGAKENKQTF